MVDVRRDERGNIDVPDLLLELEFKTGGEFKVTDWVDVNTMREEYPHLTRTQAMKAIAALPIGDYDEAINKDTRRAVLDEAVKSAGFPVGEDDLEEATPSDARP